MKPEERVLFDAIIADLAKLAARKIVASVLRRTGFGRNGFGRDPIRDEFRGQWRTFGGECR